VTGVIADWPRDSHFKFDFLGSLCTYKDSESQFWLSNNYYTYLLLQKGTDPATFQKALNDELMKKYIGPDLNSPSGYLRPSSWQQEEGMTIRWSR